MSALSAGCCAQGKRILVTGGSGFLGTHLLRRLVDDGAQVFCLALPGEASTRSWPTRTIVYEADVRDRASIFQAFDAAQPEIVFHLAAVGTIDRSIEPGVAMAVNVGGTANILDACQRRHVRRLVHAGTSYEYCGPINAYVASKLAAWKLIQRRVRHEQLPVVCLRLFHAYGPGQPAPALVASAILAALNDQDFEMTPGEQQRDLVYVEDLVEGMVRAVIQPGLEGMTLDLGTGCGSEIACVVCSIYAAVGSKGSPRVGMLPYRQSEAMRLVAETARTERLMGWRYRVGLDEGLAKTIAWYRNPK